MEDNEPIFSLGISKNVNDIKNAIRPLEEPTIDALEILGHPALRIFKDNYDDMNSVKDLNLDNADKYFHAKANCESTGAKDENGALLFSLLKEVRDISKKNGYEPNDNTLIQNVTDSFNDIGADLKGIIRKKCNPNIDCRLLLEDLRPNNLPEQY